MSPAQIAARTGRRFTLLAPRQSWTLRLPPSLGPSWMHRRMLRGLDLRATSPTWAYDAMVLGHPTDFDPQLHQRLINERILRRTRRWSWPAREMGNSTMTIYEQMRRRLLFGLTLANLREHIVRETNAVFARLNLGATLRVEGLASAGDIREALSALELGSKPFQDLLPVIRS